MNYSELKAVQKYDSRGNLLGTYNHIFIQDGRKEIKDDFIRTAKIEECYYESMLKDFEIYDDRVIADYKSSSIKDSTVYHVSYGQRDKGSLSVFFRIYAVEVNGVGVIVQPPGDELYSIVRIITGGGPTFIKLKRKNEEKEKVDVRMDTGIFQCNGKAYRAVMEIVGVGSHIGSNSYKLAARNEKLIEDRTLIL